MTKRHRNKRTINHSATRKKTRLKTLIRLMELGYTAIAYNHSIKPGALSRSDVCAIPHIPLFPILQAEPNLPESVKFHRELLNVDFRSSFKQYTRVTVCVDSSIQCKALNSGNAVLKSYDLVAVRPLNQATFDYVCKEKSIEVDMIAIDFSENVPFRLDFHKVKDAIKRGIYFEITYSHLISDVHTRRQMISNSKVDMIAIDFSEKVSFRLDFQKVKDAIERGIYFEITYSHLISDVHTRRQMISNSKLLLEWTRGKNLIFSSAAASASELRGPYDVANLSSLLGLSVERAKDAISKNCRLVNSGSYDSAVRKKQFYQNAIKVERISTARPGDSKEFWFCDGDDWDHISRAEGDLLLDDTTKFSSRSNVPNTSKSIDFASIAEEMASNGFALNDFLRPCKVPKTSKQIDSAPIG